MSQPALAETLFQCWEGKKQLFYPNVGIQRVKMQKNLCPSKKKQEIFVDFPGKMRII